MSDFTQIERHELAARAQSGARWFYWIAALSLVTSVVALAGFPFRFIVSLGVTQVVDAIANAAAAELGGVPKVIAFFFDLLAAGMFALVGLFASKKYGWVFLVGMAVYLADALLFIIVRDFLGIAFHAFALYSIYGGYRACERLRALEREERDAQTYTPPPPPVMPGPVQTTP